MNRIFLPGDFFKSTELEITGNYYHHLIRVKRARKGEQLLAVCGNGLEYRIEITHIGRDRALFRIVEACPKSRECSIKITLYPGFLKAGGIEEILSTLVYLGVYEVVPIITQRSISGNLVFSKEKQSRINRITEQATALSGRTSIMKVEEPVPFEKAIQMSDVNDFNLLFWEEKKVCSLKNVLRKIEFNEIHSAGIFTGPEGGFTKDEIVRAEQNGIIVASLGLRILDARIAPIAALSAILYESGNL